MSASRVHFIVIDDSKLDCFIAEKIIQNTGLSESVKSFQLATEALAYIQAKAQEGMIGWMRWRFMGDQAGHDMFVGSTCKICTDTAFSGVVKTPSLDSL